MNIPCPTPPVICDGDSVLIPNVSSELPDRRLYYAYRYFLDYSQLCVSFSPIVGGLCEPADSGVYSSNPQSCIIDCDGSLLTYTAPSGSALGLTQAEADAAAYLLACQGAQIVCDGGTGTLIPNQAQTCNMVCSDGSIVSATIPAGAVLGFSQSEANSAAFIVACQVATSQCPDNPPPQFGNSAVSSTSNCPSGGTFTFNVPANTFFASTLAEANAAAQSYADQQAVIQRLCLGDILGATCKNEEYGTFITIGSEPAGDFTWSIISGSIPPGFNFADGLLAGNSSASAVYTFTVRAVQNSTGNICTRTYTLGVIEITSASPLPDGGTGIAYSVTLTQTGIPSSATWGLAFGTTLPAGLSLSSAGVISGIPTSSGTTAFSVFIADATSGLTCTKDLSIEIAFLPMDWWKMDEANFTPRIGEVNGISLSCSVNVTSVAGGKYGNATALNSSGGGSPLDASCGNDSAPVTGLAYTGNGIDAFIWIDNPAGLIQSDTILLLTFADSGGTPVWAMRFTIDNQVGIEYDMTGGASGNIPLAASAAYRYFELYYDPALTRLGLRINDGAVMDQWITVAAPPVTAKGSISITYDRRTAGSSAANVCEMTVYPGILNSTQRAHLYNAGAGQTWPVTLP